MKFFCLFHQNNLVTLLLKKKINLKKTFFSFSCQPQNSVAQWNQIFLENLSQLYLIWMFEVYERLYQNSTVWVIPASSSHLMMAIAVETVTYSTDTLTDIKNLIKNSEPHHVRQIVKGNQKKLQNWQLSTRSKLVQ